MAYWESDQFIVLMKQGNACGGRGLTVEPLGQGHIFRTQMRVKGGNKTVLTTDPPKKRGWGGSSEEPDGHALGMECIGLKTDTRGAFGDFLIYSGNARIANIVCEIPK